MQTELRYTPQLIVDQQMQFVIPLYQRLFAWGEEQIGGLMLDLKEHFLNIKTQEKPYYLGQMTVVRQNDRYALIDGQQRFTALTLFAIALLSKGKQLEPSIHQKWQRFLSQGDRLAFVGRTEDRTYLQETILQKEPSGYINVRMDQAIHLMQDQLPINDLDAFADRVYRNLSFFFAELDESYVQNPASLNKYFEVMNSTGKGLEQHEILKVELMRGQENQDVLTRIWNLVSKMDRLIIPEEDYHNEQGKYLEAIRLCRAHRYVDAIKSLNKSQVVEEELPTIDVIDASDKEPQAHSTGDTQRAIISFPKFLLLVLNLTGCYQGTETEKFYRPENLITLFKKYKPQDPMLDFYGELLHYRLLLDYYCVHKNEGKHVLTLREESDTETAVCLKQYLSMLDVSTAYYRWLKPYLQYVHNQTEPLTVNNLLKTLKEIDDSLHQQNLPDNVQSMTFKDMKMNHYLFYRLDYYLFEHRADYFKKEYHPEIMNYEFRESHNSIEHLHPQNESNNTHWQHYDLNEFGNLAMISQSFNSEQSNDPVDVKFARVKDQAKYKELQSLKLYLMYLQAEANPESWTEELAEEHGKQMYQLLKKSYERE